MSRDRIREQTTRNYNKLLGVEIKGIGSYLPEKVLKNSDLEKMMDTSDEWITSRTGIKARHVASDEQATSDLGAEAALNAINDAGLIPEDIDLIILATATPDHFISASASIIQHKIKAGECACYDIAAGCSGFVYGIVIGAQYVQNGKFDNVLVIGSETLSRFLNWDDRNSAVLFGDGAGAVVLSKSSDPKRGFLNFCITSNPDGGEHLTLPAGGSACFTSAETVNSKKHTVHMNGKEVFKFATTWGTNVAAALVEGSLEGINDGISYFIPHQANERINLSICKRLNLDSNKMLSNIATTGNTSSASIPLVMDQEIKKGTFKKGDSLLAVGFGAGLTAAGFIYRF